MYQSFVDHPIYIYIYIYIYILVQSHYCKCLHIITKQINGLKSLYDIISADDDFFCQMGSKHCNTDGSSRWTARRTMLKNKPHLVPFHESLLVSL